MRKYGFVLLGIFYFLFWVGFFNHVQRKRIRCLPSLYWRSVSLSALTPSWLVTSHVPSFGQGASPALQPMSSFNLRCMDANPYVGLWLQATFWEQWGEKPVLRAVPYHAPSCSANGTDVFCPTRLASVPPPSLQQPQVMRELSLERSPGPSAEEAGGPLSSSHPQAPRTSARKLRAATQPLASPGSARRLAWPAGQPVPRVAGDFQSGPLREMQPREWLGSPLGRLSGVHCRPGGRKSLPLPGLDLPKLLKAER